MSDIRFEWDDDKASANQRKHRVSFSEAVTVFFDEHALLIGDPDHSEEEDRFLLLGLSQAMRALVVCHCYKQPSDVIRIISARKANRSERLEYDRRLPR